MVVTTNLSSNQTCCPEGSPLSVDTCVKSRLERLLVISTLMEVVVEVQVVEMVVKVVTMTLVEMMLLIPAKVALNIMLPRLVQSVWKIS